MSKTFIFLFFSLFLRGRATTGLNGNVSKIDDLYLKVTIVLHYKIPHSKNISRGMFFLIVLKCQFGRDLSFMIVAKEKQRKTPEENKSP